MNKFEELEALPELRHLLALVKLAEHGSLIDAAEKDAGRQSNYSRYIASLQVCFGTDLVRREGRGLVLTDTGNELARIARDQLRLLSRFRGMVKGLGYSCTIAAEDGVMSSLVIPALARNRRESAPFRGRLLCLAPNEISKRLVERRLDFGVARREALPESAMAVDVAKVSYVVLVPRRAYPRTGAVTLATLLATCPFVGLAESVPFTEAVGLAANRVGAIFRPEITCGSLSDCVAAVRSGGYAAILPSTFVDPYENQNWRVVEDDALRVMDHSVALAWNPSHLEVAGHEGKIAKERLLAWLREEAPMNDSGDSQETERSE